MLQKVKGDEMKKLILLAMVLGLLVSGCAEGMLYLPGITPYPGSVDKETISNNLSSCLLKLTKEQLLMKAGPPTERIPVINGEIWVYQYQKSETSYTDADPLGLFGALGQMGSSEFTAEYAFSVRLEFSLDEVLIAWSYKGNYNAFNHPFKTLRCN